MPTLKEALPMETAKKEEFSPVDFPAELMKRFDRQYIKEAVAALLYYNGSISSAEACEMLGGIGRRHFEDDILSKFGLSVIGGTQQDFDFETEGL